MLTSQPLTGCRCSREAGVAARCGRRLATQAAVPLAHGGAGVAARAAVGRWCRVLVSQPSPAMPLQLAKPALQAMPQAPPAQGARAVRGARRRCRRRRSCEVVSSVRPRSRRRGCRCSRRSRRRSAPAAGAGGQPRVPFGGASRRCRSRRSWSRRCDVDLAAVGAGRPLQSAKPALQVAICTTPPLQAGVPLATAQALPQPPQLAASLLVLTSQPSAGLPLQSAKPVLQRADAQHAGGAARRAVRRRSRRCRSRRSWPVLVAGVDLAAVGGVAVAVGEAGVAGGDGAGAARRRRACAFGDGAGVAAARRSCATLVSSVRPRSRRPWLPLQSAKPRVAGDCAQHAADAGAALPLATRADVAAGAAVVRRRCQC